LVRFDIVNVVATASLGERVNLKDLGAMKGVTYNQEVYGGRVAYFRLPSMKGTVSVFSSGKMISTGTKSEDIAINDLTYVKDTLVEKGFTKPVILVPMVQNIVVTANLGRSIDLETLAGKHRLIYEPEQFPGAILKITEPYKASILLFASGKAVITGLKNSDEIPQVLNMVSKTIPAHSV